MPASDFVVVGLAEDHSWPPWMATLTTGPPLISLITIGPRFEVSGRMGKQRLHSHSLGTTKSEQRGASAKQLTSVARGCMDTAD